MKYSRMRLARVHNLQTQRVATIYTSIDFVWGCVLYMRCMDEGTSQRDRQYTLFYSLNQEKTYLVVVSSLHRSLFRVARESSQEYDRWIESSSVREISRSSRRRDNSSTSLQFLLLLFLPSASSSSSSSSSFHQQQHHQQRKKIISHLPGFDGPLPFQLQTGYVEVDESNGVRLFYYFIRSERKPEQDPVMLWLTGGPGCSAFSGLVYEIGPLSFDRHSSIDGIPKLLYKPDSWTRVSNIIFLDSPVGTGFSYSKTEQGYKSSDTKAVNQIVIFLKKWFDEHPEFLSNPLYIAGDSYCGMIVPAITLELAKGKEDGNISVLNVKGYLVGNPVTDGNFDSPAKIPFLMGWVSYLTKCIRRTRIAAVRSKTASKASSAQILLTSLTSVWRTYAQTIFWSLCALLRAHIQTVVIQAHGRCSSFTTTLPRPGYSCQTFLQSAELTAEYIMFRTWANNDAVRDALGIHKGTVPSWLRRNYYVVNS